ncbi:hypothetical protein HYT56_01560 [Candidatus Woesearchaeota archaeon]|nr:hypothetical protein [Candidatus Woesearchaeota archaeon]
MNGLGKYRRALHYLNNLEETVNIDIKDFKQIQELKEKLKHTGYKLRSLETTRAIFFILLYSSVVSAFSTLVPGLETVAGKLVKFGSIIGSTISLIIIGISSKAISTYVLDLNIITSHLISIYTKNGARATLRKKKKQKR